MTGNDGTHALNRLERELDYYKRECNDLGARLHRAQEEQNLSMREARRARAVAKLVREAYMLADYGGPDVDLEHGLLSLVLENAMCDLAMLLRAQPDGSGRFTVLCALGGGDSPSEVMLRRPPRFLFTTGSGRRDAPASELTALLGASYILWGHDPGSGVAVLLGNQQEANATRPFEPADEELVQAALTVYLDASHRKDELRQQRALPFDEAIHGQHAASAAERRQPTSGIQECEIQEGLREGGRVMGFFVVDRSNGGAPEFVGYLRGTWTREFHILRTFRDKADRVYRDLSRLVHLARFEFGYTAPIIVYAAGAPELRRFGGVCERDRAPLAEGCEAAGAPPQRNPEARTPLSSSVYAGFIAPYSSGSVVKRRG
jgi:hypothetical protein